ncbi:MAG: PD40 domain-containing protein [Phycisphaerae bacterium]|nr:PD40 domain-containing protein [Phycisphaerae bacterium]
MTMYFSRYDPASGYKRLMEARRDTADGVFTQERVLTELVSTGFDLILPWISADGLRLYYNELEASDLAKLKMAQRASLGETWSAVRVFNELHVNGADAERPSLTEDELLIFFSSRRPGSAGTVDLWMASRASRVANFGNLRPLYEINTFDWDRWPCIMPDGLTLYFSSANRGNDTDMHLYKATRTSLITSFENVELVVIPRPSPEVRPHIGFITTDQKTMLFNRAGGSIHITHWIEQTGVFHVDTVKGNNNNDGQSRAGAFKTIQAGVDMAAEGSTVLVWPGVYNEQVNFRGKAITVQSAADPAVVRATSGYAFSFYSGERADSVLKNFVIRDSEYAIYLANGSAPTLKNLTIVSNQYGISAFDGANPDVANCILWGNTYGDLFDCRAKYSCIQDGGEGDGNIRAYPLFADPAASDYHLKSERGRYVAPDPTLPEFSEPVNLPELNDGANKAYTPCLSTDGLTMYFDRYIPARGHRCIVEAYRDFPDRPFTQQRVVIELADGRDSTAPWISQDELRLYYRGTSISGGSRIKMAQRSSKKGNWIYAKAFDELHANDASAAKPSLTSDELTIVFHSNRSGGAGETDLWMATRTSIESPFANIRPLYEINSGRSEASPFLLPNGLVLYFTGIDLPERQGWHTYRAERASVQDNFGNVQLILYGNSSLYSSAPNVAADEKTIHFASGGAEGIYVARAREGKWLLDAVTSPCIDAGDPGSNPTGEPVPNGGRINMGAYGGTASASMSEWPLDGDFNRNGIVDLADFAVMAQDWMTALPWHGH